MSVALGADGQIQLDWESVTGAWGYNLEATTNLLDPDGWRRIGTDTDGTCSTNLPAAPEGDTPVYYRLRVW